MQSNSDLQTQVVLDLPAAAPTHWNVAGVFSRFGRHIKPVVTGSVLLAAVAAISAESSSITSNAAVISATVITVRAPLEGVLTLQGPKANSAVELGATLGAVSNPRVNTAGEQLYLSQGREAMQQITAIDMERGALLAQKTHLLDRTREHTAAASLMLASQVAESERIAAAREASLDQAKLDLERGRALYAQGILSQAAYEKLASTAVVALSEASAQEQNLAATRAEQQAMREGLMIEGSSNNDVAYSAQRTDEIDLRLADLNRERAFAAATADAAKTHYLPVAAYDKLMGGATIAAHASGELWKWYAADGERLGAGDRVAEIVDCRESFLLASFPQDRVPAISIGAPARYRLAGESEEHAARVASIDADQPASGATPLAARPVRQSDSPAVLVRLTLDPKDRPRTCAVGRTAAVAIDARAGNLISTLFKRYF